MPRGIPNVKADIEPAVALDPAPETEKRITMKLERHYRPSGSFEVVGHFKPRIERKNPAGRMEVIQEESFVPGEAAPPPYPGVTITGKIWAGTILALNADEAKRVRRLGIGSVELPD